MRRFRFVHAADLHLGSPFKGLLAMPAPLLALVRESAYAALSRLTAVAVGERADFVLFAGDVYDAADRSLKAQFRFKEALETLGRHGIRAFVVHGNHDPESGRRASLAWPDNAHFFPPGEVERVPLLDARGAAYACVHGISYRHAAERDDLSARFAAADRGVFNIALLHANVDGEPGHDNYAPCRLDALKRAGFDYWALGHIHARAVLHERPWVVYPGNPQGRHMKESGPRGVMLAEVENGADVRLSFRETDAIRWERRRVDITAIEDEQALLAALLAALDAPAIESEPGEPGAARDGRGAESSEPGGKRARPDGEQGEPDMERDEPSFMIRLELVGHTPLHATALDSEERVEELLAELRHLAYARWEREGGPFRWPESIRVHSAGGWDRDEWLRGEGFVAELLRCSEAIRHDEALRSAFVEQALSSLYGHYRLSKTADAPTAEELEAWLRQAEDRALQLLTGGGRS